MSKFTTPSINAISPYVPGEQPRDKSYVKLNTNENPYYTAQSATDRITLTALQSLNRYSDPESAALNCAIAKYYGVGVGNVLATNGSDEALAFAFMAYGAKGLIYPDVTYGFYDVIGALFGLDIKHVPLRDDFTVDGKAYYNSGRTVVLANPNAQTGIAMTLDEFEAIITTNPENIVIIDQAYADFGKVNAIPLIKRYKNLVVVNTFSKSRSLAGARVGYIIADGKLIEDLKKIKNSFHPYNVNSLSASLAAAAIADGEYFDFTVGKIVAERERLSDELKKKSFEVLPSSANFVLCRRKGIGGEELYLKLKEKGVLVRHFSDERICDFVRITVGNRGENDKLLSAIGQIITEEGI